MNQRGDVSGPLAVLFDMDGTLIDTEPWWFESEKQFCASYGVDWKSEDAISLVGSSLEHTAEKLKQRTGTSWSFEQITEHLLGVMTARMGSGEIPWRPGISELIRRLKDSGVQVGLVTSSHRQMVEPLIESVGDGYFDVVVTGDDVANPKPDPEPYLRAMEALGTEPQHTVVLEDSWSGIRSAVASGANVVAIPCIFPIPPLDGVSRVISAEDLSDEALATIVSGVPVDNLGDMD